MEVHQIVEQIRIFGREVFERSDGLIKIEGGEPMTPKEAEQWIERQRLVQCPHCGRYR